MIFFNTDLKEHVSIMVCLRFMMYADIRRRGVKYS